MGKEILLAAKMLSDEKNIDRKIILEAISEALSAAACKRSSLDIGVRVDLDAVTGDYETFRTWEVVVDEELEFPQRQLTLEQARERVPDIEIGGQVSEPMKSAKFDRIAAQIAKQVITQRVREAERQFVVTEYQERIGQLLMGVVKRTTRDNIIVDLGGKAEALLPRSEMLGHEIFRPGDRVRSYLYKVQEQARGPQLYVSRIRPEMLIELFKIEVPEIGEEVIEVKGAARDPGFRAKIAVKTNDGRIDPIGACVGMRGARVQAVSGEFGGERIDIILWDDNPAQLVINAMSPSEVSSIVVDEDSHTMDIAVAPEQLSQAIGRNGQNVRLASELTGWTLNVMTSEEFANKGSKELEELTQLLIEQLGVDEDLAVALTAAGFSSIEEIAYIPAEEFLAAEGFDEELVASLQERANDVLLTKALVEEEELTGAEPAEDLLVLEGMERQLAYTLAQGGIITREDLAEQSVDDLLDLTDLDRKVAGQLIMKAREHWFTAEEDE
ncbi:MAG: transcription termination factor NusA [Gammaproteobacteria bacterium]